MSDGTATPEVALRMDDVGASSKEFEVYARRLPLPGRAGEIGNVLFLKYLPPLRAWGPYPELSAAAWTAILGLLRDASAVLTVGITASWVERSGRLVPFPQRFPEQAEVIRQGVHDGLLEVADHGLTHCVLAGRRFLPRAFGGNRMFHREFWDWVPADVQRDHLQRAQWIFRDWLGSAPVTFVPPGNVFGNATIDAARAAGLRVMSCATTPRSVDGLAIVGNERVDAFHDRDVVLGGVGWLRRRIAALPLGTRFRFVRDLAPS